MGALAFVGCILLFALWFADTVELVLLFSSWLLVLLLILMPIYWPWYVIPPLALALCSTSRGAGLLMVLLTLGALLGSFFLVGSASWSAHALLTVGLPFLLWGWLLFFTSTWQMARPEEEEESEQQARIMPSFSRAPWLSRPSWPSRPERIQSHR
jgi:fatty acid desaturase